MTVLRGRSYGRLTVGTGRRLLTLTRCCRGGEAAATVLELEARRDLRSGRSGSALAEAGALSQHWYRHCYQYS